MTSGACCRGIPAGVPQICRQGKRWSQMRLGAKWTGRCSVKIYYLQDVCPVPVAMPVDYCDAVNRTTRHYYASFPYEITERFFVERVPMPRLHIPSCRQTINLGMLQIFPGDIKLIDGRQPSARLDPARPAAGAVVRPP